MYVGPFVSTISSINLTFVIYDLYSSPNIIYEERDGQGMQHVWGRGAYSVLVWKSEGKRPLGRFRYRWEANINMDLEKVKCGGIYWIDLAQDRDRLRNLVNAVIKIKAFHKTQVIS
jgi:hypothetical protein